MDAEPLKSKESIDSSDPIYSLPRTSSDEYTNDLPHHVSFTSTILGNYQQQDSRIQHALFTFVYSQYYLLFYVILFIAQLTLIIYGTVKYQLFSSSPKPEALWYIICDVALVALMIIEIGLRIGAAGSLRRYFRASHNIVDFVAVILSLGTLFFYSIESDYIIISIIITILRYILRISRLVMLIRQQHHHRQVLTAQADNIDIDFGSHMDFAEEDFFFLRYASNIASSTRGSDDGTDIDEHCDLTDAFTSYSLQQQDHHPPSFSDHDQVQQQQHHLVSHGSHLHNQGHNSHDRFYQASATLDRTPSALPYSQPTTSHIPPIAPASSSSSHLPSHHRPLPNDLHDDPTTLNPAINTPIPNHRPSSSDQTHIPPLPGSLGLTHISHISGNTTTTTATTTTLPSLTRIPSGRLSARAPSYQVVQAPALHHHHHHTHNWNLNSDDELSHSDGGESFGFPSPSASLQQVMETASTKHNSTHPS